MICLQQGKRPHRPVKRRQHRLRKHLLLIKSSRSVKKNAQR
ncbi:Uncharacterised protein [Vibrio cholerae]|nr:Uncharacterised protein [Vibrio cholerae]